MAPVRPERSALPVETPDPPGGPDPGPVGTPARGEPVKLAHGSLYETPDGGYHIAYQWMGSDETHHYDIPPGLVKMYSQVGGLMMRRAARKAGANGVD